MSISDEELVTVQAHDENSIQIWALLREKFAAKLKLNKHKRSCLISRIVKEKQPMCVSNQFSAAPASRTTA